MHKLNITSVRDAVQAELLEGAGKELLQYLFAQGATICVFAGAVRDTVFAHEVGLRNISPRDWDIGISGIPRKEFNGILEEFGGSKNKYGGFRLFSDTLRPWEIWRQEDTVGLLKTGSPFSLENVLRSFVLSCNAIACDLDKGHIYDCGAVHSIFTGKVTLLDDAIMHDWRVFAAKALSLTFRRPLRLSNQSEQFVRMHLNNRNVVHELSKAYSELPLIQPTIAENKHGRNRSILATR
jgi:hypothetical protein